MKKANKGNLPAMILLFMLLILWQLGAMKVNAAYILPTPLGIVNKLWELRAVLFAVHLPATMGVRRPTAIKMEEDVMPGTMKLRPHSTPQNTKPKKLAGIS